MSNIKTSSNSATLKFLVRVIFFKSLIFFLNSAVFPIPLMLALLVINMDQMKTLRAEKLLKDLSWKIKKSLPFFGCQAAPSRHSCNLRLADG